MTFDFDKFYSGLLKRDDPFDNYWDRFETTGNLEFKEKTLKLLEENLKLRDEKGLNCTLGVLFRDGIDKDYTELLISLLGQNWHSEEEDIVSLLEDLSDPRSIDVLYKVAIQIPEDDEMRALAKKCMWVLSSINTDEAIQKLKLLQISGDPIIMENATFQLEQVLKKN